ncbi:M20 family metallopeptidase [Mesorhizobium sp. NZP2298]|uniref:M20 family metallopeptidase n=1 Tax=Mesorhizobium sp. NZP2298 TaxID=2483403 RepID=UPI001FEF6517|nr:M20/M25/M40 family metallo-hydrolase [Mesorhizobium sp. NZP2298]
MLPEAISLLRRLVATNSINPLFPGIRREDVIGGETACGAMLADHLSRFGFASETVAHDPERKNTVMRKSGTGGGRSLFINGHVDTVAPFRPSEWLDGNPWSATIKDGRLYGLGSTDMKSGLVAAALAASALDAAGVRLKGELQIHAVVGEETMSHELGTSSVLDAGFGGDAAIVVEPTSQPRPLSVTAVSAGNFNLQIDVKGYGTHSGNRGPSIRAGGEGNAAGVNAVEKAMLVVQALQQLEQEWGITKSHPAFPAGIFSMVPGVFHGDAGVPSVGYLAESATVGYLVWYPPNERPAAIRAEIENHVHHASQLDSWLRHNPPVFRWESHWPVFDTSTDHPLIQSLVADRADVLGALPAGLAQTHSFNAVCDASFIAEKGIPVAAMGPGDLRCAHAVNEFVQLTEVSDCARILARTMMRWCGVA